MKWTVDPPGTVEGPDIELTSVTSANIITVYTMSGQEDEDE